MHLYLKSGTVCNGPETFVTPCNGSCNGSLVSKSLPINKCNGVTALHPYEALLILILLVILIFVFFAALVFKVHSDPAPQRKKRGNWDRLSQAGDLVSA